jgi:CRP/FNR family transcriptional regulator, cyclic AMP receptor protein
VSIRRESVTRELKALERAGLIEKRRGAMVLTDTARLRQMIAKASEAS